VAPQDGDTRTASNTRRITSNSYKSSGERDKQYMLSHNSEDGGSVSDSVSPLQEHKVPSRQQAHRQSNSSSSASNWFNNSRSGTMESFQVELLRDTEAGGNNNTNGSSSSSGNSSNNNLSAGKQRLRDSESPKGVENQSPLHQPGSMTTARYDDDNAKLERMESTDSMTFGVGENPSGASRHSLGLNFLFGEDKHGNEVVDESNFPKHHTSNGPIMTIFLLLNTMIGSGILNQPQVFATAGVVSSVIMLIITAVFTWLGIAALVDTGIEFKKFDFSELSLYAFGRKGEVLVDVCIAIGNFGALLSYMIVIGSTATDLFASWGCAGFAFKCSTYLYTPLIVFVFVVPVYCKRVFGELAFFSVISMISIGSIVLLTMIGGPIVGRQNGDSSGSVILSSASGFISQLGSIIFALSCSFASFHTFISLRNGTAVLWRRVTGIAMTCGVIMLFVIGLAGYLSFKTDTQGIILDNFTGNYSDIFKIMLIIHLVL
jgi:hypothetical protein